jgi:hypothetical protein
MTAGSSRIDKHLRTLASVRRVVEGSSTPRPSERTLLLKDRDELNGALNWWRENADMVRAAAEKGRAA